MHLKFFDHVILTHTDLIQSYDSSNSDQYK